MVVAILDLSPGAMFNQVNYTEARTALVTTLILCQLFLVIFLKPPTRQWVGGAPLSGDRRYTLTSLLLGSVYLTLIALPPFQRFFELAPLSPLDYVFLIVVVLEWCLILRALWRSHFLDRFLGVDLSIK
jgi:cation-transporting ATPase E